MPGAGAAAGGSGGRRPPLGQGLRAAGGTARDATPSRFLCAWRPGPGAQVWFEEGVPGWIGGVCFPGVGVGGWRQVCGEWGGVSFEVGTPLPPHWESQAAVGGDSPCSGFWARGGREDWGGGGGSGGGDHLGLRRHKARPRGPARLYGGCTEPGLIRGTRPRELLTGLDFPALLAPLRPAGAQRPAGAGRGRATPWGAGGGRVGNGAPLGPGSACGS